MPRLIQFKPSTKLAALTMDMLSVDFAAILLRWREDCLEKHALQLFQRLTDITFKYRKVIIDPHRIGETIPIKAVRYLLDVSYNLSQVYRYLSGQNCEGNQICIRPEVEFLNLSLMKVSSIISVRCSLDGTNPLIQHFDCNTCIDKFMAQPSDSKNRKRHFLLSLSPRFRCCQDDRPDQRTNRPYGTDPRRQITTLGMTVNNAGSVSNQRNGKRQQRQRCEPKAKPLQKALLHITPSYFGGILA